MTANRKDPVLVVLQLTGGNDYMNTVIPHADPLYREKRPVVGVADDRIIKLNDRIGLHPEVAPLKRFWDAGDMAIIHGVGYANSPRSHFRSMDIWHTCEPDKLGTEGWLGRATRDMDPNKDNVITAVNFGPSLPRALALPGVPVACIDDLDNFGMLTSIQEELQRDKIIDRFTRLYSPTIGSGFVMDYLSQTGLDGLKAADILKVAPERYSSTVEYPDTPIARKLKGISQVHQANLGTRVFYTDHGSFDSHSNQIGMHDGLWRDVSAAVGSFFDDLRENDSSEDVILLMFSEFGRRVHDNGSGTDHGAAGLVFVMGDRVQGGEYGEFPSTKPEDLEQGDLVPNTDFRSVYSTILENWLGLDANQVIGATFEKPAFI